MTVEELGAMLKEHRLLFISISRTPSGEWQVGTRVNQSAGFTTYVTTPGETLDYAISRVVPGLFIAAEPAPAEEEDIFG